MSKLPVGVHAPEFSLRDVEGRQVTLAPSPFPLTVAIFFKTTCPTCHYAWPYYERLHNAYAKDGLRVLGVSQHDRARTADYRDEYKATFSHLVDDGFAVSQAYDPAYVPTGFLIDANGAIVESFESWDSRALNELSEKVAAHLGVPPQTIVKPQDNALSHKLG